MKSLTRRLIFLGLGLGTSSVAFAQPVDPAEPPAAEPEAQPTPKQPTAEELTAKADLLADTLKPQRGGATARDVGKRAKAHSPAVKAQEAKIRASAAQVDQAMVAFLPKHLGVAAALASAANGTASRA